MIMVTEGQLSFDYFQKTQALRVGQADIQDDDIGPVFFKETESLMSGSGGERR